MDYSVFCKFDGFGKELHSNGLHIKRKEEMLIALSLNISIIALVALLAKTLF
jgi:hypothetical protein